jgi:hypothetical protein
MGTLFDRIFLVFLLVSILLLGSFMIYDINKTPIEKEESVKKIYSEKLQVSFTTQEIKKAYEYFYEIRQS